MGNPFETRSASDERDRWHRCAADGTILPRIVSNGGSLRGCRCETRHRIHVVSQCATGRRPNLSGVLAKPHKAARRNFSARNVAFFGTDITSQSCQMVAVIVDTTNERTPLGSIGTPPRALLERGNDVSTALFRTVYLLDADARRGRERRETNAAHPPPSRELSSGEAPEP